jgi:hypothetical protein
MTGKTTPLYIVCSPCRCVGKTLISRLLTEFCVLNDRPVAAFDLADEGPQLVDYLPKCATIAEIGDIHGQMALFDRLIAESDTPSIAMSSVKCVCLLFCIPHLLRGSFSGPAGSDTFVKNSALGTGRVYERRFPEAEL